MNPLTGPRLAPLPNLQTRCEQARAYYARLGTRLGRALVEPTPIRRLCRDATERDRARETHHPWRGAWQNDAPHHQLSAPFGSLDIHHGWRLNLTDLLATLAGRWSIANAITTAPFDWTAVHSRGQSARWQGHTVGCVVSCEGAAVAQNPYWRALPLQADGGESLVLKLPIDLIEAVSAGFTLLPLGEQRYWLGATHSPGHAASGPTVAGRNALLSALAARLSAPLSIEVLGHFAGTRMAPPDREPVLGRHPKQSWLAIFNGLGSRGILRAPDSAIQLSQHLVNDTPLPPALDLLRYAAHLPSF
jgi:glycine/D-amino acid oxidase-like deaminating enzyme